MKRHSETYYYYWLVPEQFEIFILEMKKRRRRPLPIRGVPCKGMNPDAGLCYVAPETWNKVCNRQGSWYRISDRRGQYLVISPDEPEPFLEEWLEGVIISCDFVSSEAPTPDLVKELVESDAFRKAEPNDWKRVTDRDVKYWSRLLEKTGSGANLEDLIAIHSANHANFIAPRLYVEEDEKKIPYSIGKTWQVCSACVELFNLLGAEYSKKYVMPCPGFCLYTKREADRFYLVLSGDSAREWIVEPLATADANGASAKTE